MAIAFVQAVRGAVANNGTLSITPTAGNALVAFVVAENGSQSITVTDTTDSRSFTQFGTGNDGNDGFTMSVFLLSNIATGTAKTITFTCGSGNADCIVAEYSGGVANIDAHIYNSQSTPGTGANAITSGTFTVAAGDLSVGWCVGVDTSVAQALVAGNGTSRNSGTIVNGGLNRWSVLQDSTTTGSVASTFTDATNGAGFVYDTLAASLSTVALGNPGNTLLSMPFFGSQRLRELPQFDQVTRDTPLVLSTIPTLMGQCWT